MTNLIFYDFEVFKFDWLCVFRDQKGNVVNVINNKNLLQNIYNKYKNNIFVGYNSRRYDQFIFRAILLGLDPYNLSKHIINSEESPWKYCEQFKEIKLYNYDTMTKMIGLKTLEGFMGHDIRESSINFDIDRALTGNEIQEILKYCDHDVQNTINVFEHEIGKFKSHMLLIKMFNLPLHSISQTVANLAVSLLGAKHSEKVLYHDEFVLDLPEIPTLKKYRFVYDWFCNPENHSYKMKKINSKGTETEVKRQLEVIIANVPHVFAWGGVHGSVDNSIFVGIIINCDVSSYYPNLNMEYNTLSRNIPQIEKVKIMIKDRLKYKASNDEKNLPLKDCLNSLYGKSKDKYSPAYDPRQANRTCVIGQLLLLDLIESLEEHIILINTNTDGIIFKIESMDQLENIKNICREWEKRSKMTLEFDKYSKIIQKDVNNYIILKNKDDFEIVDKSDPEIKSKGAYVKKLKALDNDLPIINKAIVDYFVKNIPVETTINECNELMQFQQICKVSKKYINAYYNDKHLHERIFRLFAVKENGHPLYKLKKLDREKDDFHILFDGLYDPNFNDLIPEMDFIMMEKKKNLKSKYKSISLDYALKRYTDYLNGYRIEKVANTPMSCIIHNESVVGLSVFDNLDRYWYIKVANDRINKFLDKKIKKSKKMEGN